MLNRRDPSAKGSPTFLIRQPGNARNKFDKSCLERCFHIQKMYNVEEENRKLVMGTSKINFLRFTKDVFCFKNIAMPIPD
jgi:hypothetical protein